MANSTPGKKVWKNQVIRFVLSAGAGFVVDVSLFYLLFYYWLSIPSYHILFVTLDNYTVSLFISYTLGVVVNFLITKYFVFSESKTSPSQQFLRFASVAVIGFFANLGVIVIYIKALHLKAPVARPLAALSLFFASYFVHKLFSFSLALRHHAPKANNKHRNPDRQTSG